MNYSDFVMSIGVLYALYYGSMVAFDYYKASKKEIESGEGETVDISDALDNYVPKKAEDMIEKEMDPEEGGEPEENEIHEEEEDIAPVNHYSGFGPIEFTKIIGECANGDNFFAEIIPASV